MTKFEEELMATAKMIPTSDGNEIKFKTSSALYDYLLLSNGEAELYLESQLQQQALPVVSSFVAEWYEENEDNLELSIYNLCVDLDKKSFSEISESEFDLWFDDTSNKGVETLIRMKDGYKIKEEQKFYLKNKLTDMYLYKKSLGGYGEEPTDSIEHLTDDFKFTQKEINEMDAQGYDKKDEYKGE